jgi:hypothetical protein
MATDGTRTLGNKEAAGSGNAAGPAAGGGPGDGLRLCFGN